MMFQNENLLFWYRPPLEIRYFQNKNEIKSHTFNYNILFEFICNYVTQPLRSDIIFFFYLIQFYFIL